MLDFIGMIIAGALMTLVANALITFMDVSRGAKMESDAGGGTSCRH